MYVDETNQHMFSSRYGDITVDVNALSIRLYSRNKRKRTKYIVTKVYKPTLMHS